MHSQTGASARIAGTAAAVCLLALTSGCFGPPPTPQSSSEPQTSTTSASSSATTPSGNASSANGNPTAAPLPGPGDGPPAPDALVIRWIPIGPASPSDPPEGTLYELLRKRDCTGLRESTLTTSFPAVWSAAEATCEALATDLPGDWQRAGDELGRVPDLPRGRCWEIKVTESLRQAVELRAAHPGSRLYVDSAGAGDDCPRQLRGLTVLDGPHAGAAPPLVPAGGGPPVQLEGFLVNVDRVLVNGSPVDVEGPQFGPFVFYAPPSGGAASATVAVEASPPVSGTAELFYDPVVTGPGPGPTISSTAPPPEPPPSTPPPTMPPPTGGASPAEPPS